MRLIKSLGGILSNLQLAKVRRHGIDANLAPDAFAKWAHHYLQCEADYSCKSFSPVPYFLLCRAIELAIKSIHLNKMGQPEVKSSYGHDILKAYEALPGEFKVLVKGEQELLKVASEIYAGKQFEYFEPQDVLTGFSRFPSLVHLRALARKFVELPLN